MYGYRKIISLLTPALMEAGSIVLLGLMNTMMVSHLGEDTINAVNLAQSPGNLVSTVVAAISVGITVKISHYIGRGTPQEAKSTTEQGSLLNLLATGALSLLLIAFASPILTFLFDGLDAHTMEMARTFFVFIALSLPPYAIFHSVIGALRGIGDFKIIFVAELLHNALYLGLGYLFIHGFGFGITGLGIALVLCRTAGGLGMYFLLRRGVNGFAISSIFRKLEFPVLKGVLSIGIPTSIDGFFGTGGALFLQTIIVSLGSVSITANALATTLRAFFGLTNTAMATVAVTVIAQAFGSGDFKEARRVTWRCAIITILLAAGLNYGGLLFLKPLIGLYQTSAETADLTRHLITMTILFDPIFNAMNLVSWSALRAVGDVKFAITASIIRFCIVRLLGSFLLVRVFHLGIDGIWYAIVADYTIAAIIFTIRFLGNRWERLDRI